jgi:hypothetical protein
MAILLNLQSPGYPDSQSVRLRLARLTQFFDRIAGILWEIKLPAYF